MASDTWTLFHQAVFVVGTSQINANVAHLGHRCVLTALMKLSPGSMPRYGSSDQNLEHYLKTKVYIFMLFIIMQVFRAYS